jgi:hypothetical protein
MKKAKKRMTAEQEFEVLKLVLDKYLWLGTGIMVFGLYKIVIDPNISQGVSLILTGTVLLLLFVWLIVKEYEFLR